MPGCECDDKLFAADKERQGIDPKRLEFARGAASRAEKLWRAAADRRSSGGRL